MKKLISPEEMENVYNEMRTPHKLSYIVFEEGVNIDCAMIYRVDDGWRMIFARQDPRELNKAGYETWMAESCDLIKWNVLGKVLKQTFAGWDGYQRDGSLLLIDPIWGGSAKPELYEGKYWMSYIGGGLPGYETDPLSIGMATSDDISMPTEWKCFENPILRHDDVDSRVFERSTLYKSYVIRDTERLTGYDFVMYYNAKNSKNAPFYRESIGMAVSNDMKKWQRYGACAVMDSGISDGIWSIAGDPQIVKFGDLWVMHYFIAYNDENNNCAYDTFACSRDLVTWTKWNGSPLVSPSIDPMAIDSKYAHKPYLIKHEGMVYHFYCACGDKGRGIALAVSSIE